eukprot:gene9363-12652_t
MTCYAIVKVDGHYVVQVDNQGVIKFRSRRKAIRSLADAQGLLDDSPAAAAVEAPSHSREPSEVP